MKKSLVLVAIVVLMTSVAAANINPSAADVVSDAGLGAPVRTARWEASRSPLSRWVRSRFSSMPVSPHRAVTEFRWL